MCFTNPNKTTPFLCLSTTRGANTTVAVNSEGGWIVNREVMYTTTKKLRHSDLGFSCLFLLFVIFFLNFVCTSLWLYHEDERGKVKSMWGGWDLIKLWCFEGLGWMGILLMSLSESCCGGGVVGFKSAWQGRRSAKMNFLVVFNFYNKIKIIIFLVIAILN